MMVLGRLNLAEEFARLDPKLLDRVEPRSAAEVVAFPNLVDRGAVEERRVAVDPHSIGLDPARRVAVAEFDAWDGDQKRREAAPVDGKLLDALPLERMAEG